MKRIMAFVLALVLLSVIPVSASAAQTRAFIPNATYLSPEGIRFISYSSKWGLEELKELYDIFKQLPKGEEIGYLNRIVLLETGSKHANGRYFSSMIQINDGPWMLEKGRRIEIYEVHKKSLEEVGWILAHEYGHHFTYYWLLKAEGKDPDDPAIGWAKVRQLGGLPVYERSIEHFWDPEEIMADDYAVLFAPPALKQWLAKQDRPDLVSVVENQYLPAAESIPELRAYWARLTGLNLEKPAFKAPEVVSLKAKRSGRSISYEVVTNKPLSKDLKYAVLITNRTGPYGAFLVDATPFRDGTGPLTFDGVYSAKKCNIRIYAYDPKTNRLTYSPEVWFDFSDRMNPKRIESLTKW